MSERARERYSLSLSFPCMPFVLFFGFHMNGLAATKAVDTGFKRLNGEPRDP